MSLEVHFSMQGTLKRNEIGRWEIVDSEGKRIELSSGSVVDVKIDDHWVQTRIEHNGKDYYPMVMGVSLYSGMPAREPFRP